MVNKSVALFWRHCDYFKSDTDVEVTYRIVGDDEANIKENRFQ